MNNFENLERGNRILGMMSEGGDTEKLQEFDLESDNKIIADDYSGIESKRGEIEAKLDVYRKEFMGQKNGESEEAFNKRKASFEQWIDNERKKLIDQAKNPMRQFKQAA